MIEKIRVQKFLSQKGLFSRRETEALIREGRMLIDGEKAILGDRVTDESIIAIDGDPIEVKKKIKRIVIAFYKPKGVESTLKAIEGVKTLVDFDFKARVFPIGRLDKDSHGLLLLTNDGELSNKLAHPSYQKEKEYLVVVDRDVKKTFLTEISKGLLIDKYQTKPCFAELVEPTIIRMILTEGRNRQIRKMCLALGYKVRDLLRIRVGVCQLGELKEGRFRVLSEKEIKSLTSAPNLKQ